MSKKGKNSQIDDKSKIPCIKKLLSQITSNDMEDHNCTNKARNYENRGEQNKFRKGTTGQVTRLDVQWELWVEFS